MGGIGPGMLPDRVQFSTWTRTSDGAGGSTATKTAQYSCWAKVSAERTRWKDDSDRLVMQQPYAVWLHYRKENRPQPGWVMTYRGEDYNVLGVVHVDERQREIKLMVAKATGTV